MRLLSTILLVPLTKAFGFASLQKPLVWPEGSDTIADIPQLGFGTWNLSPDHDNATDAVKAAIVAGYRHIDCAAAYKNEPAVGRGIAAGLHAAGLSRSDIWVTSKLWNTAHHSAAAVRSAADKTVKDLGVGYLDLYLMHWPVGESPSGDISTSYLDTWLYLSDIVGSSDIIRRIGVCNFDPQQMRDLLAQNNSWHAINGIRVTAYSPLGNMNPTYHGKGDTPEQLLKHKKVKKVAKEAGCSPAQVVLKWGMSKGIAVIPKSQHVERIEENFEAPDCELQYEHYETLNKIGKEPFRFNNPSEDWGVQLFEGLQGV